MAEFTRKRNRNSPSAVRHDTRKGNERTLQGLTAVQETSTVTAKHCDDALRASDDAYIAEYADAGKVETIVAGVTDRSLTNALGIRFRKPELELEPIPTRVYSREHGRMIVPLTLPQRLVWKSDDTLLNRGTFRRTDSDKIRRTESRSKETKAWRLPDDDPAAIFIRDTPTPKPEPEPVELADVDQAAKDLQAKFGRV